MIGIEAGVADVVGDDVLVGSGVGEGVGEEVGEGWSVLMPAERDVDLRIRIASPSFRSMGFGTWSIRLSTSRRSSRPSRE